jgi:hypothetical protein
MKIRNIQSVDKSNGVSHIEAFIDDEPLWFSSENTKLTPATEVFASALLIPAFLKGEDIEFDQALDEKWLENSKIIQSTIMKWWGLPKINVLADSCKKETSNGETKTAQFFTGGVDSYYELISNKTKPDYLVYVLGFDIKLSDLLRFNEYQHGLNKTASYYNCTPIIVKTNYRTHHFLRDTPWKYTHGGALAAVGHSLSLSASNIVIPSSYSYQSAVPWGSHWALDPLWSSNNLQIEHADASKNRFGKLGIIADHDLVKKYLRVCWENQSPTGNCSRCEKCVRNMIMLEYLGELSTNKSFDLSIPLSTRISQLPFAPPYIIYVYEGFLLKIKDPLIYKEIVRLIRRSKRRSHIISLKMKMKIFKKKLKRAKKKLKSLFKSKSGIKALQ